MSAVLVPVFGPNRSLIKRGINSKLSQPLLALSFSTLVTGTCHFLESFRLTPRQARPLPLARIEAPDCSARFSSVSISEDGKFVAVLLVDGLVETEEDSEPSHVDLRASRRKRAPVQNSSRDHVNCVQTQAGFPPAILVVATETMGLGLRVELPASPGQDLVGMPINFCSLSHGKSAIVLPFVALILENVGSTWNVLRRLALIPGIWSAPERAVPFGDDIGDASRDLPSGDSSPRAIHVVGSSGGQEGLGPFVSVSCGSGSVDLYATTSWSDSGRDRLNCVPVLHYSSTSHRILAIVRAAYGCDGSFHALALADGNHREESQPDSASRSFPQPTQNADAVEDFSSCRSLFWVSLRARENETASLVVLKSVTGLDDQLSAEDFPVCSVAVSPFETVLFCTRRGKAIAVDMEVSPSLAFQYAPLALDSCRDSLPVAAAATSLSPSRASLAVAHHIRLSGNSESGLDVDSFVRAEIFKHVHRC